MSGVAPGGRRRGRRAGIWRMVARIAGAIVFVAVFSGVAALVLVRLPPALALLWSAALGASFLAWHLRRGRRPAERRALIRMRRPRGAPSRLVLACASTMLLAFGVSGFVELWSAPMVPEELGEWGRIIDYQRTLGGWIALASLVALVIPMVEEFCFRGYVQRSLERRYGPWPAIGVTALLFTVVHVGAPRLAILLIPLVLGLAMGAAAYLFSSIWVAVAIHALWNGSMAVLAAVGPSPTSTFGAMAPGVLIPLSLTLIAAGLAGWYPLLRHGRRGAPGGR